MKETVSDGVREVQWGVDSRIVVITAADNQFARSTAYVIVSNQYYLALQQYFSSIITINNKTFVSEC